MTRPEDQAFPSRVSRRRPLRFARRLLLAPAVLLVALGAPVLALEEPVPPAATTDEVAAAREGQTVEAGWESVPTALDANLIGVKWEGDPNAEFSVEVRGSDGQWTRPVEIELEGEPDAGTKDATAAASMPDHATEPVWVGEDVTAVRVEVTSGVATNVTVAAVSTEPAVVPGGSAGALTAWLPKVGGSDRYLFAGALFGAAVLLGAIGLGWSPWRHGRAHRLLVVGVLGIVVLAACAPPPPPDWANGSLRPTIISRAAWGARPFGTGPAPCPGGPEYAPALKFAVVHHTVNGNSYSADQSYAMMRAIQAYHMDANGWCDIGYHFVVDRYGQIFEARDGGVDRPVIGGHAGGFNSGSTGVALLGDYTSTRPTTLQWGSLVHLLRWRLSVGGVNPVAGFSHVVANSPCNCMRWPAGTPVSFANAIVWHRDVDSTACPGNSFAGMQSDLRTQVQSGIVLPPSTTTTLLAPTTTTTTTG